MKMIIGGIDGAQCMSTLLGWSCCPRCALRYIGLQDETIYSKPLKDVHSHICEMVEKANAAAEEKSGNKDQHVTVGEYQDSVCVACLGMLQDSCCSPDFIEKIAKKKAQEGHDVRTFFSPISFPVSLTLRQHALWVCLSELYPEIFARDMLDNIVTVKEVWRWINLKALSSAISANFEKNSPFHLSLNFDHISSQKECNFLYDKFPNWFKKRKNDREVFNKTNVQNAVRKMSNEEFKKNYQSPPRVLDKPCHCDISCSHQSVYLAGRYNKYSRILSQTEWIVDGERKTESSIAELICDPLLAHFQADKHVFTASGREDVDVKMLGDGRPFIVEIFNPRRTDFTQSTINKMQDEINSSTKDVAIRYLQVVPREATTNIKDGEMEKIKCYSAVCWSSRPVTQEELDKLGGITDLVLQQKTPIRVLHRRALATRPKMVHSMKAELVNPHHFLLHLKTQAGTYIKEFVHSDMGRTTPHMATLLKDTKCDILELNVEAVLLDWPKPINDSETLSDLQAADEEMDTSEPNSTDNTQADDIKAS